MVRKAILMICISSIIMILPSCTYQDRPDNGVETDNAEFQEPADIDENELRERIEERRTLSVEDALQGMWIEEDGTIVRFTDEYFMQGEELEHVFSYKITEETENELHMTLYGVEGFMVKGRNLFNINVVMDETRTQMIVRKYIGGMSYVYHMVSLDADGVKLSDFDTSFFGDVE